MRLRTGGSILTPDGTWVVRTTDQGPARGRVEGSRGGGGLALSISTDGFAATSVARVERTCAVCGAAFASKESLATHRSRKHRETA